MLGGRIYDFFLRISLILVIQKSASHENNKNEKFSEEFDDKQSINQATYEEKVGTHLSFMISCHYIFQLSGILNLQTSYNCPQNLCENVVMNVYLFYLDKMWKLQIMANDKISF